MRVLARLLGSLRRCLEGFPDKRRGTNTTYRIADFGMAAFSAFFMQSPSFLDFQRRLENGHARSNCQTLFDIPEIPTDNQIRDMLDPAEPELLHPVFAEPIAILEGANGGLDPFRRLGDHVLIALDGTEYFSSRRVQAERTPRPSTGKQSMFLDIAWDEMPSSGQLNAHADLRDLRQAAGMLAMLCSMENKTSWHSKRSQSSHHE
jgi:hypothetical protein